MDHWRAHGGEVDIILEYDSRLFPIEIKASTNPSRRDTSGITAFRKRHPGLDIAKGLILSPSEGSAALGV